MFGSRIIIARSKLVKEAPLNRHTWQQLNRVFAGTESESRWTKLATIGLAELSRSTTDAKRPATHAQTFQTLLETAQAKKAAHDPTSAAMFDAMEDLYRNEPSTLEMIRKAFLRATTRVY